MAVHPRFRPALVVVVLLAGPGLVDRLPAAVTLQKLSPGAVSPGRVTRLTCRGTELETARTLWTSFPAEVRKVSAKGDGAGQATFEVTLPAESIGRGAIRVVTDRGVSNVRLLLRESLTSHTDDPPADEKPLTLPLAIDGSVVAGEPDRCRIQLKAGERLTVDLWARRLGSSLDPVVRVIDPGGRTVIAEDDTPGLAGDVGFSVLAADEGVHTVSVTDVRRRGGDAYRYRLRLARYVPLTVAYPLFVRSGQPARLRLLGPGTTADRAVPGLPAGGTVWVGGPVGPGGGRALLSVQVDDRERGVESEPNDDGSKANPLAAGAGVSGLLDRPGDRDWFRITLKKGQRLQLVGRTASLGVAGRLYMRLCNAEGGTLVVAPQQAATRCVLDYTAAADAEVRLLVEDLQRRGGPGFAYHLDCRLRTADFDLGVAADRLQAVAGGSLSVKVTAARRDFQGAIRLSVEGLGKNVMLAGELIPAGKNETTLKITLPAGLEPGSLASLRIVGSGQLDTPPVGPTVKELSSIKYDRGDLGIFDDFISDKKGGLNFAEYDVELANAGEYLVLLRYAAAAQRVAVMKLDGRVVNSSIMSKTTGSWSTKTARWFNEGLVKFPKGKSVLRLEKVGVFSHLTAIRIALPAPRKKQPGRVIHARARVTVPLRKDLGGMPFVPRELDGTVLLSVGKK